MTDTPKADVQTSDELATASVDGATPSEDPAEKSTIANDDEEADRAPSPDFEPPAAEEPDDTTEPASDHRHDDVTQAVLDPSAPLDVTLAVIDPAALDEGTPNEQFAKNSSTTHDTIANAIAASRDAKVGSVVPEKNVGAPVEDPGDE